MLTAKQEKFAQGIAEGMTQADAYRASYSADKMKPETVQQSASRLMADRKVAARVDELKAATLNRHRATVDDLIRELEEARSFAKATLQPAAMTSATMGKAKLLGLDKQIVEHSGPNGGPVPLMPTTIELVAPNVNGKT